MHQTVSSLLITTVAVVGTLLSALLAQRQARRAMTEELGRLDRRRVAEAHRAGYTAMNTAARRYLVALTNQLHALALGADLTGVTTDLRRARATHADHYAEIQLIAPPGVLAAAQRVNHDLNQLYGVLMRLTNGVPRAGDSLDAAQARITALWGSDLVTLRRRMRLDLDPDLEPSTR